MGEGDGSSEVHGVKTVTTSQVLQHQSHRRGFGIHTGQYDKE